MEVASQHPGCKLGIITHPPHYCAPGKWCGGISAPVGTTTIDTKTITEFDYDDETVLDEAGSLIYGDRQQQYGNAKTNFDDIGHLWEPILGVRPSAEQVALCLMQLKVARAINDTRADRPIKRDTIVDLAGYAGCIEKIQKGV